MGAGAGGLTAFLLLHSPLVGPQSWEPVADLLAARDLTAVVPSLAGAPTWTAHAGASVGALTDAAVGEPVVIAGHSGAGPALAAVGGAVADAGFDVAAYHFVDAGLPRHGATRMELLPDEMAGRLRSMARDGVLPRWSEWWGDGGLEALLPDPALRERFVAGLDPVPLALFDEPLPVPEGWPDAPCGYVRLSEAYDGELAEARRRGWPTADVPGHHLSLVTDPATVVAALLLVAAASGVAVV